MTHINYSNYIITRNFVKQTNYERINTGRRSAQTKQPPTAMTAQELDTAYQYRQRAKREKLLRLADVNFEAGACVFVTLTFQENVQVIHKAVTPQAGGCTLYRHAGDPAEGSVPLSSFAQCS